MEDQQDAQKSEPETSPEDQTQLPIPVPIMVDEETRSLGMQTLVDDVFQSTRNHWGFSLAAYQAYTTDVFREGEQRRGAGISAFIPRIFFNVGKRKSRFHADAGGGYRFYNNNSDLNSWDYYGGAQYSYQFSRRASFQIGDQYISSYNDSWSFLSLYSPIYYNLSFSNEVLFNRQRITRNSLVAQIDFQASRRARLGAFGGYIIYKYPQYSLRNADSIEAGGEFDYQLARWLHFSTRYSSYLNYVDDRFRDAQIHRLQVGAFNFRLSRAWRIWAGGGIEMSDYEGEKHLSESVSAGIGYTTRATTVSATYQRGFTSAIGIARLMQSDVIAAQLGHRISSRISARVESYYYRSREEYYGGLLETFSAGGGLEFSLRSDLFLSVNGYYQNQQSRNFSIEGLGLSRMTAYVGLQYVWPSRRRSDYSQ